MNKNVTPRKIHLTSFYPLCCNKAGLEAIDKYGLNEFIDGSCRREPNFEHPMPAITGLCRPGFVNRLSEGHLVVYVTNKKGVGSRKLVAILEVVAIKDNHSDAADYYNTNHNSASLPNNIMTDQTSPLPLDRTHRLMGWWGPKTKRRKTKTLAQWDGLYKKRSSTSEAVAICKIWKKHRYLKKGQAKDIPTIMQRMVTQNPSYLSEQQFLSLVRYLGK